jgi:phosphate starvation-inducible PhoH-like protein
MARPLKKANTKFLKSYEIDAMENVSIIKKSKKKPNIGLAQFQLKEVHPLTENQGKVFNAYKENKNIICCGSAGTGKSLTLLYLMLQDLLYTGEYEKIIIYRTAVQTRNIGFTPGSEMEKAEVYSAGIKMICNDLLNRADAYELLCKKDLIEFNSTSFARSITHNNSLVLFEEAQSATLTEISMIATRIGYNSRLFLTGDSNQNDLDKREKSGFPDMIAIAKHMESMEVVNFTVDDIVRSSFVKEFLVAKDKLGL